MTTFRPLSKDRAQTKRKPCVNTFINIRFKRINIML